VASEFPEWKQLVLAMLLRHFDAASGSISEDVWAELAASDAVKACNKGKQPTQFAAMMREQAKAEGAAALALAMPFDEQAVLSQNLAYLRSTLYSVGVKAIHIYTAAHGDALPYAEIFATAAPGAPGVELFFSDDVVEVAPPAAAAGPPAAAAGPPAAAAAPPAPAKLAPPAAAAGAAGGAKLSMMEYLEKHDVTGVLNQMVNDMATEQPADPFAFLSAELAKRAKRS